MSNNKTERSKTRVKGFADEEMDFQLMRQLGASAYRGASIGECLSLAATTKNADPADWVKNFTASAVRIEHDADERSEKGHGQSAFDQYLRASNAYRAAEYYTEVLDPAHKELGLKSRHCFLQAMKAVGRACEILEISHNNRFMPGYFLPANRSKNKTVIAISGFDGTMEETFIQTGMAAIERGYNLALMAGPGQMDTYRFISETRFEPDYETPVAMLIDTLSKRTEVDNKRIGLIGISFGGYFATRAASEDDRIKALVANSPIVNLHQYMTGFLGFDPSEMPDNHDFTLADIPNIPENIMSIQQKNMASNLIRRFGCESFKKTFIYMKEFTVLDKLSNIKCPCLGLVGEGEGTEPLRQYEVFLKNTGGPATGKIFTTEEGADGHCQVCNLPYSNAVLFDWMDEVFAS